MGEKRSVTVKEIRKHASAEDCWIVVDGNVWNITNFAPEHPGGPEIIYGYAGRDATEIYNSFHAPSMLPDNLEPANLIGRLDENSSKDDAEWQKPPPSKTVQLNQNAKPPLDTIISSYDFEEVAERTLSKKAWAFYSSAATDLITRDANKSMFDRIWFRPRILRNVRNATSRTRILGCDVDLPLFVSPAAVARLAHPDGEKAITAGCKKHSIPQCISTNASFPIAEIFQSSPGHPFFFQLYVNKDRTASESLLSHCRSLGARAVILTVDAPVPGKREADERVRADGTLAQAPNSGMRASNDKKGGGLGRTMSGYIDATVNWEDIKWLRRATDLPLVLKGIQTAADARLAMEWGVEGIIVSNHGGRSLDTSPPAILTLLEIHRCCPEVFSRMEVYLDSGIRRGTDILKCLCLGATAVGMGRHFLYAANYGPEGVEKLIEIMKDELETAMRLVGITDVAQAHPGLVNTLDVDHLIPTSEEHSYARRWRPLSKL